MLQKRSSSPFLLLKSHSVNGLQVPNLTRLSAKILIIKHLKTNYTKTWQVLIQRLLLVLYAIVYLCVPCRCEFMERGGLDLDARRGENLCLNNKVSVTRGDKWSLSVYCSLILRRHYGRYWNFWYKLCLTKSVIEISNKR